jgi:anaerobic selenocysteine-containing dehydrogenase
VFIQPKLAGDFALIKAMAKRLVERDDEALAAGQAGLLDRDFIARHTSGFEAFEQDLRAESWDVLLQESGVPRAQIEQLADIYIKGKNVISTWGMGLTQHKGALKTIQMLSNLMMRGQIGRPARGPVPGARPLQRAGRPHHGHRGKADQGLPRPPAKGVRFRAAAQHGLDTVDSIKPCWMAASRSSSAWAAISRWPRRTRRSPSTRCASAS